MPIQPKRAISGALAAALGGLGLVGLAPALGVVADPTLCITVSPAQSWIGLRLHLIAESASCAHGGYQGTPLLGFSVMISISALIAGLAMVVLGIGGGLAVRTLSRRVNSWLRRRWLPVVLGALPTPQPVAVVARSRGYRAELAHHPVQRRGPPRSSC
jgi:hypothetical protein